MRKIIGLTKYRREKLFKPRNTHEKNVSLKKYPREETWDPRRCDDTMVRDLRDHNDTRPT